MIRIKIFKTFCLIVSLILFFSCSKKEGKISIVGNENFVKENQNLFQNPQPIKYESCFRMITIIPISFGTNYDNTSKMVEEALEYADKKGINGNVIIDAKIKASMILLPPIYGSFCSILEGKVATLNEELLSSKLLQYQKIK